MLLYMICCVCYVFCYRECAIKMIFTFDLTADEIRRVAAESQILSSLRHPNIIGTCVSFRAVPCRVVLVGVVLFCIVLCLQLLLLLLSFELLNDLISFH
jgi:hypothetical protein